MEIFREKFWLSFPKPIETFLNLDEIFLFIKILFIYVHGCFICLFVCEPCVCLLHQRSEDGTGSLRGLELQVVVCYHVGLGNLA